MTSRTPLTTLPTQTSGTPRLPKPRRIRLTDAKSVSDATSFWCGSGAIIRVSVVFNTFRPRDDKGSGRFAVGKGVFLSSRWKEVKETADM